MRKEIIVPVGTKWARQERGTGCWPVSSFWINLTSELMSPTVIRAVIFPKVGLHIFQLPRKSSAAAHSSAIFQVLHFYHPAHSLEAIA